MESFFPRNFSPCHTSHKILSLNPTYNAECGGGATWPPLHTAVFASTPDIVAYLIESGADVNLTHGGNVTPLYFACRYQDIYSQEN